MNQQREIIREILPLFLQSSQKMLKNSLNSSKGEEEQGDEELLISPSQSATHLLKELVSLMSRFEMIDETLELISYIKKDPGIFFLFFLLFFYYYLIIINLYTPFSFKIN